MFKMLGEEVHHMSLTVVFGSVFVILQLLAHECFNSEEGVYHSERGRLTRG